MKRSAAARKGKGNAMHKATGEAIRSRSMFDAPEFEAARAKLAEEIDAMAAQLIRLQEAYEGIGGTYEDEVVKPESVKLLTGPATARAKAKADDVFTERQSQVYRLFTDAADGVVKADDIASLYAGMKSRWYVDMDQFKRKLKAQHGQTIVTLRGIGYRLEEV